MNRSFGVLASVVLHSFVGVVALVFVQASVSATLPRTLSAPLTYINAFAMPEVPPDLKPARLEVLRQKIAPPPAVELPKPEPRVEPVPVPAPLPRVVTPVAPVARAEPMRSVPSIEPRHEPAPLPIEPPKPQVAVGVFAATPVVAPRAPEVGRTVETGGFDTLAARAPQVKVPTAAVGAFDQASAAPQAGTDRPNRAVASAGFSSAPAASVAPAPAHEVRQTDFDARAPMPAASQTAKPAAPVIDTQVEILSKPTPVYTDEARAMKLEGEVVLEVEFTASGAVHVLHVVRGLGHGLDEAATRAAAGMRFTPARSAGRPVDYRTTVHIVFRLA